MDDWNFRACLNRYRMLMQTRPDIFGGSPPGSYEILLEDSAIERAKSAAAQVRANDRLSSDDLRVGVLADDPYALVMREAVRFPDGQFGLYNRFIVPTAVVIFPLLGDRIVLLYRYRHGTRSWHHEFPRGIVEPDDGLEEAARRELFEEIGGQASDLVALGGLHASNGITNEYGELYLAHLLDVGRPDPHEAVLRIDVVDPPKFRRMIADGRITDGSTLAAYARAQTRGLIK